MKALLSTIAILIAVGGYLISLPACIAGFVVASAIGYSISKR